MPDAVAPEFIALQQALIGRYSLDRELGRGGMGIVFLARDVALDRSVAIKLLPPAMAAQPALRERFLREAQTAAKLSHPNIIPIFAVETVDDFVFFVMAYVEGETLGQRIRAKGPLSPRDGTKLIQEVAWALAYAHLRGIVHRDIKPDNILLEQGSGRALVSDFGIARVTETSGSTAVGEVLGTAQYMSPEQACGEPVDGRSDLYSLGVVGFFALSGKLPFDAPDIPALLAMQITKPAPPLGSAAPGIPKRIAQAVDRCLAKDPAARFPTGEALAEAVAQSTELSRELPAPLRVWLTKGRGAKPALYGWSALMALTAWRWVEGGLNAGSIVGLGLSWGAYLLYRLHQTQRILAAGYGLEDLRLAVRQHTERRREEIAFEQTGGPSLFGRLLRGATLVAFGTAIASGLAVILFPAAREGTGWFTVFLSSYVISGTGVLLGRAIPGRILKASGETKPDLGSRLWLGRVGKWLFKVAGVGVKRPALPAGATHRPTELAIGLAADALFESLPKETRKELKDLPALVRRLEADAQATRARVEELAAMLEDVSAEDPAAKSASLKITGAPAGAVIAGGRQKLRDDLAAQRDVAQKRLGVSVAALENIRLDLLRLKAGVGTVDQLSADLSAARELEAEIELAIQGQEEVAKLLRNPRGGEPAAG
ncbi:MAG: serine/threonine-protein kinase [Gemmatimonadales bacterium]|nr:serine/threonine-protein kinase [Gemmatimonadales bacterium]